ncbi:MAG TPA: VWA domain-containing protein, partial [Pyrinomonadaceae bacterium]
MRNWLHVSFILACVILACVAGSSIITRAQQQRSVEQTPDKVVISKNEVPFDVVVRDKKGRPVKDLTAAEFEVYEDGVKQEITSFRFVSSGSTSTPATPATKDAADSAKEPSAPPAPPNSTTDSSEPSVSAVALVFDRLTPESRLRARDAALSYLGDSVKKNELVGVFLTDLSVVVLQQFTEDAQLIKAGIEK